MLQVKLCNKKIATDEIIDSAPKIDDPEILICLNCSLPECVKGYNCARFTEERKRIRREGNGKRSKK